MFIVKLYNFVSAPAFSISLRWRQREIKRLDLKTAATFKRHLPDF